MNQRTIRVSATEHYEIFANKITVHFTHTAQKRKQEEALHYAKDLAEEMQCKVKELSPKSYPFEAIFYYVRPKSLPHKDGMGGESSGDTCYEAEFNAAFNIPVEGELLEKVLRLLEKTKGKVWFEYGLEDPTFAKQLALKHAMEAAKDKAEEIAFAMDGKLGEIIAVESDAGTERMGLKKALRNESSILPSQAIRSIAGICSEEVSVMESVTVTYNVE